MQKTEFSALRHVALVNLGTPEAPTPEAVRAFLDEFLSDPLVVDFPRWFWLPLLRGIILRSRPRRVAQSYASIWTDDGPPLLAGTRRIVRALQRELDAVEPSTWKVHEAYRYGAQNLSALMQELEGATAEGNASATHPGSRPELQVIPLFPQRTGSSSGSIVEQARELAVRRGWGDQLRVRELPADDPGYIDAVSARIEEAERAASAVHGPFLRILASFHGIPVRYDRNEGHQYTTDCAATLEALRQRLGGDPSRWELTFQSKFGPERWLQPATAERIAELGKQGHQHIGVVTPGFVTDGLETLEEIAVLGAETFRESGGSQLTAVPAVEDHPSFVRALVHLIAAETPYQTAVPPS